MEVATHMEVKTSSVSSKRKRLHSADASMLLQSSRDQPHATQCPAPAASFSENSGSMKMCQDLGNIGRNSLGLMNQSMQKCRVSSDLKADEISLNNNGGFSWFSFSSARKTKESMESSETKRKKVTETMESSVKKRQKVNSAMMPSAEEIEEFFSAAERHEQKQFAEKYNFDIVKDVPLEGRYLWEGLKP